MPTRPESICSVGFCKYKAVKDGRCRFHPRESGWYQKGTRQAEGYGAEWDKIRPTILDRDDHLCQRCKRRGIYTPANIVDHIIPKAQGGSDDPGNLEAICKDCHDLKTRLEKHFPISAIQRPACRVVLVTGPPGAGKTTYCKANARKGDTIIDLDEIMSEIEGKPAHTFDTAPLVRKAISERNRRLNRLQHVKTGTAWVIMSLPKVSDRRGWVERLGAEVVLLGDDYWTCYEQITADTTRAAENKKASLEALDYYFKVASF